MPDLLSADQVVGINGTDVVVPTVDTPLASPFINDSLEAPTSTW